MAKKRSAFSSLLILAVLFAAVWMYFTPYLAMNRLQKAAKAGDTEALNELVDFPALRESVKTNVRSAVENSVGHDRNPLAVLGGLLAGAVAGPLVDAFVTPSGIAALTEGERPGQHRDGQQDGGVRVKNVKVERGYEGMDQFVVHFKDKTDGTEKMALVMHRDGLFHWKLTGIRLPAAHTAD
ncbi:DUF2939 domain-containing protein [Longimicrobium sp.]|uniref:DUF2939 domain-containing protein n=1 Tax=Longimicrobium sp. TaxID=2029185 RepID=UPI002CF26366|nr:DUF2939 domain-containing protein [Longimicrobium sp.]HSU12924.1 DUF2939 domain-containing protein [Longimicrobium sp.]